MWNSIVSLYYKDNTDDSIRSIQYKLQRVYCTWVVVRK